MTQDEIIEMAKQTGLVCWEISAYGNVLQAFAKLVAAKEREAVIFKNAPEIEKINAHIKMLEDELAAIRARGET